MSSNQTRDTSIPFLPAGKTFRNTDGPQIPGMTSSNEGRQRETNEVEPRSTTVQLYRDIPSGKRERECRRVVSGRSFRFYSL